MEVHVPKPLHGWREFAGEVGIIVLGVLIALGAEEVARSIADHREAAHLRQSMMNELSGDRARWEANHHDFRCTMKLLDDLRNWSERPASDRLDHFDPPLFWTMHDSAWQIARSSPTMAALPLNERDSLADIYFFIGVQEGVLIETENDLNHLQALAKTADRPTSRNALPEAATETEATLGIMDKNFAIMEQEFNSLGVRTDMRALAPAPFNFGKDCPGIAQTPRAVAR
jgi:hypothetical protein